MTPMSLDTVDIGSLNNQLCLKPKVTLHCYYIHLLCVSASCILNVFNSYLSSINYSNDS